MLTGKQICQWRNDESVFKSEWNLGLSRYKTNVAHINIENHFLGYFVSMNDKKLLWDIGHK